MTLSDDVFDEAVKKQQVEVAKRHVAKAKVLLETMTEPVSAAEMQQLLALLSTARTALERALSA